MKIYLIGMALFAVYVVAAFIRSKEPKGELIEKCKETPLLVFVAITIIVALYPASLGRIAYRKRNKWKQIK